MGCVPTFAVLFSCLLFPTTAVTHSLQYFYTATSGITNFPEFVSVGNLDGVEISYYDSKMKEHVPRQTWMKELGQQYWDSETQLSRMYDHIFRENFNILGNRFNQTEGVHVFQKSYGCQWDDKTGATDGHESFGYDGEDFLTLDLENTRWIWHVMQAVPTKHEWDKSKGSFEYRKNYFLRECVDWLKKYLEYGSSTLERTVPPEVSLFQKDSSAVCHATGFYPEAVMITWKRDGEEMQEDVDVGDTLPNPDGTFQKRVVLTMSPEERRKSQYTCEVAHISREPIVMTLPEEEGNTLAILIGCVAVALLVIGAIGVIFVIMKKKGYKKTEQSDSHSDNSSLRILR
ncbi:major histocompatibility complex class I-related gene protein-like [Sardina pilchardus]|uniref:major histocompatibility complex class I-related gene protein-like n=1 Tax=Sardina pilchardus TaxID=27697 RepID=UPI002E137FCA